MVNYFANDVNEQLGFLDKHYVKQYIFTRFNVVPFSYDERNAEEVVDHYVRKKFNEKLRTHVIGHIVDIVNHVIENLSDETHKEFVRVLASDPDALYVELVDRSAVVRDIIEGEHGIKAIAQSLIEMGLCKIFNRFVDGDKEYIANLIREGRISLYPSIQFVSRNIIPHIDIFVTIDPENPPDEVKEILDKYIDTIVREHLELILDDFKNTLSREIFNPQYLFT